MPSNQRSYTSTTRTAPPELSREDITARIEAALPSEPDLRRGIDVDGIVTEFVDTYGHWDPEALDHDVFWDLVRAHDATQEDT